MAKKKQSSSNNTTTVGILSGIFIVLIAIIAQFFFGVDLGLEEEGDSENGSSVETVASGTWYRLYFTEPMNTNNRSLHKGSAIEDDLIAAINGAETSIDAAFFELDLERIGDALVAAKARGIEVRLVLDDKHMVEAEELNPDDSVLDILEDGGFVLYCGSSRPRNYDMRCDDRSSFMHNKFIIVDGVEVWTGSTNYTHNGVYNNNNNVLVFRSQAMVENYEYIFDLMFGGNFNLPGTSGYDVPNRRPTINGVRVENYFSPDDGDTIESRIIELLADADESIYLLTNIVTLDSIGETVIERFDDGVKVQGLFETRDASQAASQFSVLGCAGVPVKHDGNPSTFHHKVIIIDGEIVITGSFNFSENAKSNSENVTIIFSAEIAQQFINEFNRRYSDPAANTPSRAQLGCR